MLPSQIAADPTAAARAQRCASAIWPTANSYFLLLSTVLLYDYGSKDILLVWLVGGSHDKGTCQFAPNANVPEIIGNPAYSFSGTLDYEEPLFHATTCAARLAWSLSALGRLRRTSRAGV